MSGLPPGWTTAELRELVGSCGLFTDGDWILSEHLKTGTDVRLIQLADVGAGRFINKSQKFISANTAAELGVTFLKEGDVLISRMAAPLARACLFPKSDKPAITAVDVAIARCDGKASIPAYFMYICNSRDVLVQAEEVAVGTTRKRISRKNLERIHVPLPPLQEQRRIVAKLEKVLEKVDSCQKRLARIPILLKRFRQSVLAAACSGHLTADWRKEGSELGETPIGWREGSVGEVIESLKYGTSQKCTPIKKGVPVLRIPNVANGSINLNGLKYAELPAKELNQLRLKEGDILLIRSNGSVSLVGKTAIVGKQESGYAYAGYLIRLRPNSNIIQPEFLNLFLSSYDIRLQIELEARSTSGVNNINSDEVRSLHILILPLAEQKEIVRRIGEFYALADQIEVRFKKAQAHVDKLTQSILAKAFRGELVPQDPNDELASALLERNSNGISPSKEPATLRHTKTAR